MEDGMVMFMNNFEYEVTDKCVECGNTETWETNYRPKNGGISGFCRYCKHEMKTVKIKRLKK